MRRILLCMGIILLFTGITIGAGKEVGVIGSIDSAKKEILVNVKSGTNLNMGDLLEIETESGKIILNVTFPMTTTSKCKIQGKGNFSELKKGMAVSRYSKDDESPKEDITGKAGETKEFGDLKFVFIKGGQFKMGSPKSEKERQDHEKQHPVKVSSFWMKKHEVTQREYKDVMGRNPSKFGGRDAPVEQVTWYEAVEYCNKLSEKQGFKPYYGINKDTKDADNTSEYDKLKYTVTIIGGTGFRLPTEAEWEYACRGGATTPFHYGNKLDSAMANFDGHYPYNAGDGLVRNKTLPVGSFKPNAYDLYDMHGNVAE